MGILNSKKINSVMLAVVLVLLVGCDSVARFKIKGRDGYVAFIVPRDMLQKGMRDPDKNASIVMLNLYPDVLSKYHGDILALEKFIKNSVIVSYRVSKLKESEKFDEKYFEFDKYPLDRESGFALVKYKESETPIYLECAEVINKNTRCWYFGEFDGYLTYKLSIPLRDVGDLNEHVKEAEREVREFIDKE